MGQKSGRTLTSLAGRIFINEAKEQVLVYDENNIPIALLGLDSTGAICVKVAQAGTNVITAPNEGLIFNSNQDTFKIAIAGNTEVNKAANTEYASTTISYAALGYNPVCLAFTIGTPLPMISVAYSPNAGLISQIVGFSVNVYEQEITFFIQTPNYSGNSAYSLGTAVLIDYYLLQETSYGSDLF